MLSFFIHTSFNYRIFVFVPLLRHKLTSLDYEHYGKNENNFIIVINYRLMISMLFEIVLNVIMRECN